MPRKIAPLVWLVVPLPYVIYFFNLAGMGLVGPDEPRYASVGRAMALSGDWVTPRLWGAPWFEKPALLYWLIGAGNWLGLGPEVAGRLPVALLSVGFLVFFWWMARREFGSRTAWIATLVLGTSAMWLAYSQVGVPDLPLAVTFSAAMLLALPWVTRGDGRFLPAASALFGLAALAKGLTPVALAVPMLPVAWWLRRKGLEPDRVAEGGAASFARPLAAGKLKHAPPVRDLLRLRVIMPFVIVALPWYALCYARNGRVFFDEFFWKHHVLRVTSPALAHVRPWWYYLPVLVGALLPWAPLLGLLFRRASLRDFALGRERRPEGRRQPERADPTVRLFLAAWLVWGMVFFSVALNKLPGYILPLLPAAALLIAAALEETKRAGVWLVSCALLLAAFLIAAPMLPAAMAFGTSRAPLPRFHWMWVAPAAVAAAVWVLEAQGRRLAAVAAIAAGVGAGIAYVKVAITPEADRVASARSLWREIEGRVGDVCVEWLDRDEMYGLNYYAGAPLPRCQTAPRPVWVRQRPDEAPRIEPAPARASSAAIEPRR